MKKFEISCNLSFDAMEVRELGLDPPERVFSLDSCPLFPPGVPGPAEDDGVRQPGPGGRRSRRRRRGPHQPPWSQERYHQVTGGRHALAAAPSLTSFRLSPQVT